MTAILALTTGSTTATQPRPKDPDPLITSMRPFDIKDIIGAGGEMWIFFANSGDPKSAQSTAVNMAQRFTKVHYNRTPRIIVSRDTTSRGLFVSTVSLLQCQPRATVADRIFTPKTIKSSAFFITVITECRPSPDEMRSSLSIAFMPSDVSVSEALVESIPDLPDAVRSKLPKHSPCIVRLQVTECGEKLNAEIIQ